MFILDNSPGCLGEVGECNKLLAWGSKSQILMSEAPGNVWSLAQVSEDKRVGSEGTGLWKKHQFGSSHSRQVGRGVAFQVERGRKTRLTARHVS